MAVRFSDYKITSFFGNDREKVEGAIILLDRSYCTTSSALSFLARIAHNVDCTFTIKCDGDYDYEFKSEEASNLTDEWADEYLRAPYIVKVVEYDDYCQPMETLKFFADPDVAQQYAYKHDGVFLNPRNDQYVVQWTVWQSNYYGPIGSDDSFADTCGEATFATLRAAWKFYKQPAGETMFYFGEVHKGFKTKPKYLVIDKDGLYV